MATMQSVYITILGMGVLFFALLILTFAIMALERLSRPVKAKFEEEEIAVAHEREMIAAISVAIAGLLEKTGSNRSGGGPSEFQTNL